jgi:hypothetical protein
MNSSRFKPARLNDFSRSGGVPGSRFQVSGSRFQVSGSRFNVSDKTVVE